MTPLAPMPFPETSFALTLGLLLLAPLAIAGLALINTGLGRSRSAMQSLLGSLVVISTAVIAFALVGSAIAAGTSGDHVFHLGGRAWNWAGAGPLFLAGFNVAGPRTQLAVLFELLSVALVVLIPWGSGADRLRLPAGAVIAAIFGAVVFPLVAHWTWGGGWLSQLGANFGQGSGVLDGGGAAAIHGLGGVSALALVWIAGPRKGKFPGLALMPSRRAMITTNSAIYSLDWDVEGLPLFG